MIMRIVILAVVFANIISFTSSSAQVNSQPSHQTISDAHMRLEEEVAKWKSAGGIVDLRDTLLAEERPGVENAADIYKKLKPALDRFLDQGGSPVEGEDATYQPEKASMPLLESTVREFGNEIDLLKKAAGMEYCFWGEDYARNPPGYYLYFSNVQRGLRLLRVNVYYQWKKKNSDEAVKDIIAILEMGKQVGNSPLLMPQLNKWAFDDTARRIINRICKKDGDFHSAKLLERLRQVNYYDNIRRAVSGDIASQLGELRESRFGVFNLPMNSPKIDDKLAGEVADYLRDARLFLDAATKPVYQRGEVALREPPASWNITPDYKSDVNSDLNHMLVSINRMEAVNLVIITGLRLREYKAEHGVYPEPGEFEMPVDPLDGKRMIYLHDSKTGGIVVRTSSKITRLPEEPIGTPAHVPFEICWE